MDCHVNTIRRWIRSGKISASKFGGRIRIRVDEVKRFEEASKIGKS